MRKNQKISTTSPKDEAKRIHAVMKIQHQWKKHEMRKLFREIEKEYESVVQDIEGSACEVLFEGTCPMRLPRVANPMLDELATMKKALPKPVSVEKCNIEKQKPIIPKIEVTADESVEVGTSQGPRDKPPKSRKKIITRFLTVRPKIPLPESSSQPVAVSDNEDDDSGSEVEVDLLHTLKSSTEMHRYSLSEEGSSEDDMANDDANSEDETKEQEDYYFTSSIDDSSGDETTHHRYKR